MNLDFLDDPKKRENFVIQHVDEIKGLNSNLKMAVEGMNLKDFNELFVYTYDPEAKQKNWQATELQAKMGSIWDNASKSRVLAPREHLKTHTALSYAIKRIFTRKYPLEINYYHQSGILAEEKFRKMQLVIERNPLLRVNFDIENAKSWSTSGFELKDGTIFLPMSYIGGSIGKHPHIIILDDIIDFHVIYSETLNKKAIETFYMNIYPQISKEDEDRKIIVIGTAQRKDDIYHKLPADFETYTYQAVNEATKRVLSPEIFTFEGLMKIKKDISSQRGERYWLKEYQNVPLEGLGMIVKAEHIRRYDPALIKDEWFLKGLTIVQGWDLSVGKDIEAGDWTVGVTLGVDARDLNNPTGKLKFYILKVVRGRWDFGQRLKMIKDQYDEWHPVSVGIEETLFQYDTVQETRNKYGLPVIGVKSIRSKVESFQIELGPYFENEQVHIPDDDKYEEYITELLSLPVGEHDDQGDATKIAIKTYLFGTGGKLTDDETPTEEEQVMGNLLNRSF